MSEREPKRSLSVVSQWPAVAEDVRVHEDILGSSSGDKKAEDTERSESDVNTEDSTNTGYLHHWQCSDKNNSPYKHLPSPVSLVLI